MDREKEMIKDLIKGGLVVAGAAALTIGACVAAVVAEDLDQETRRANSRRKPKKPTIKVGDMVQWETSGKYMFPSPKKVERIEESAEHGDHLFVEECSTGIPVTQCILMS